MKREALALEVQQLQAELGSGGVQQAVKVFCETATNE